MKLLFDFFPIVLFFICYKLFGIYTATTVAMVASVIQVLFDRLLHHRFERMHLISLALIVVLGSATLFFHNPWFIKWKPTGIYWLFSIVLGCSMFIGDKTIVQKMMEKNINLLQPVWRRLNLAWALFFLIMGSINLYVAYNYSTDVWVNFKLFGGAVCTLFFIFLQAIYLAQHMINEKSITESHCDVK
ncbi:MAG: septation protein A [Legionella sp.]